jgi:activator of HSP90 ATPase
MTYDYELTTVFAASPDSVYDAWMSSHGHSAMTGAHAEVDATPGGKYEAWDGYITGETVELEPGKRIVQTWRPADFDANDADSQIEVLLEPVEDGTRLTLRHTGVPDDKRDYEEGGWQDSYFTPMAEYFGGDV